MKQKVKDLVACKRIDQDIDDDDLENLRHLYFEEKDGEQEIQEEKITKGLHMLPSKTKIPNIGSAEKPNIASIRYYWDIETTK